MINQYDFGNILDLVVGEYDYGFIYDDASIAKDYGSIERGWDIMAFNPNQAIVNRVLRVSGFDLTTGANIFTADDIQNPSWENTEETETKTSALGAIVSTFGRAKGSTFSGESTYMHFGLLAAQVGSSVSVATSGSTIVTPFFEILTVGFSAGSTPNVSLTLSKTPATPPSYIYLLNTDNTIQKSFAKNTAASATEFAVTGTTVTLPTTTGALAGTDKVAIWYDYASENAIKVVNGGESFPSVMKIDVEVLFADKCNQNTVYYGHIIYPKARPDGNFSITPTTAGTHPFGFVAQMDVCNADKTLCYTVIPQ